MSYEDVVTGEIRTLTQEQIADRQFERRFWWGIVGAYVVVLLIAITIFWAGFSIGRAGWGL